MSNNIIFVSTEDSKDIFTIEVDRDLMTCCRGEVEPLFNINNVTENNSNECRSNGECGLDIGFGSLKEREIDWGEYKQRPIDVILEDRYNPGVFYINSRTTIKRYVPGQPITLLLGDEMQPDVNQGFQDGHRSVAKFSLISGILQFNQTKMAIADFQNACVRLYDFATENVSTIIGFCDSFGRGKVPNSWEEYDENTVKASLDAQFSGILAILYLEKTNKMLVVDNAYKMIVENDFATEKTRALNPALRRKCPRPVHIIADREENHIYINHAYGVSRYNLHTKDIKLLFGFIDETETGESHIDLVPGPFSSAQTGALDSLSWLVRDQVLVAMGRLDNEAIVIVDLIQEQVYSICDGKLALDPQCITFGNS